MTTEVPDGTLRFEPGRIARIVLHAPARRNAMSRAMWAGLAALCQRIAADPAIRVVVLTGTGPAAFCAGADIAEFAEVYATPAQAQDYNALVRGAQAALAALPQPTVAAIRGVCFGGGVGLALHCDLRLAAVGARFAVTPARLGLAYSPDDSAALIAAVGPARARELLLTGRAVTADEALAMGLIHHLYPEDQLDDAVAATAAGLAALAPGALAAIKTIAAGLTAGADRAGLQAVFDARFRSDEFREGVAAFLEKRPARF
jgi:enoyl-CoA hydratase/carnithine racemase